MATSPNPFNCIGWLSLSTILVDPFKEIVMGPGAFTENDKYATIPVPERFSEFPRTE